MSFLGFGKLKHNREDIDIKEGPYTKVIEIGVSDVLLDFWGTLLNDDNFPYKEESKVYGLSIDSIRDINDTMRCSGEQRILYENASRDAAFMGSLSTFGGVVKTLRHIGEFARDNDYTIVLNMGVKSKQVQEVMEFWFKRRLMPQLSDMQDIIQLQTSVGTRKPCQNVHFLVDVDVSYIQSVLKDKQYANIREVILLLRGYNVESVSNITADCGVDKHVCLLTDFEDICEGKFGCFSI